VEVEVIAKLQVINPFDYFVEEYAEEFPFTYDQMLQQELTAYLNLSEESPIFLKFMEGLKLNKSIPTNDFLVSINQPNKENLMKVGEHQRFCIVDISCFAPLWISSTICIWLYCTIISDVKSLDGPSGPEKILQIYMPGLKFIYQVGWIGLDPTSGLCKRRTYSIVLYTTL
jgi:hypothetical protein